MLYVPCSLDNKITKQLDVVKVNKLHFVGEKITFCYLLVNLGFFCLLDLSSWETWNTCEESILVTKQRCFFGLQSNAQWSKFKIRSRQLKLWYKGSLTYCRVADSSCSNYFTYCIPFFGVSLYIIKENVLHKICVSGTVLLTQLMWNTPTCMYIGRNIGWNSASGNCIMGTLQKKES